MKRPWIRSKPVQAWLLLSPAAAWLIIFFLAPLFIVLIYSFLERGTYGGVVWTFSLENFERVFDSLYLSTFGRSLYIALVTTLACLIFGYPLAYFIATRSRSRRGLLLLALMVPFWTNFLIRTYAWLTILRTNTGLINVSLLSLGVLEKPLPLFGNDFAIILGLVYGWLPVMVLPVYAALERMDHSLIEAAQDLYATGPRVFWRVIWPLSVPGVVAGSMLVFIPALGSFVTPAILGGGKSLMIGNVPGLARLALRIRPLDNHDGFDVAGYSGLLPLNNTAGRGAMTTRPELSDTGGPRTVADLDAKVAARTGFGSARWDRSRLRGWTVNLGFASYGLLGYLFLYLPIIIVMVFSFNNSRSTAQWTGFSLQWYKEMIQDEQVILALWNSLFVAVVSTGISTVLGTLAALAMERYQFPGKLAMDALIYLPIIIPDIAMAIMLLIFFNLTGLGFEPWRLRILGVRLAVPFSVIIGHVAFNISFVAVVVRARLAQMDRALEEAAQDLYADSWQTFRRITLPMLMPGIIGGALLAFTLSLDDFVITFFTSGAGFNTLPVRVFGMIRKGVTPKINALSTLMLAGSLLLVLLSILLRKGDQDTPIDLNL